MRFGFVRRLFGAVIVFAIATSVSAATIVSFVAVRTGETLIVSNPQGSTVTGEIRLVPDAGMGAMPPRAFSLPSHGSQAFPNVLATFGVVPSPAILAVQSSDAVTLSSSPLRVAYPERHLTLPVRFNPNTPGTGSLILGILSGLIRVSIYEHPSVTPLVTRTFGSSGEQVTRLRYADLIPAAVRVTDGYAVIMPLDGQVVGTAVNPPMRRRSAGSGTSSTPVLSVTGGPACEFATGVRASVSPVAGATYRWTLLNATAQGSLSGNALDVALGSQGYASFALERTVNGSVTSAEVNVRIEAKPVYTSSGAASVTLGQDAMIEWTLAGSTPTSQTISGTDFATVSLDASARSYAYRPTTEGPKSYTLSADNACGGSGVSGDYSVSAACTSPTISNLTIDQNPVCPGAGSTMRFSIANATSWSLRSTLGNGFVQPSGAGTGSLTSTYVADNSAGNDIVTLTVVGCGGATVTRTLNVTVPTRPVITSFTTPVTVAPGMGGTIAFTYTNGTSYALTSSLGNTFTPSGGNSTTGGSVNYNRDNAGGPDTVTLLVTGPGPCALADSQQRVINDPPMITNFTAPSTLEWAASGPVSFTLHNAESWTITTSSTTKGWNTIFGDANYFGDLSQGQQGGVSWVGASTCSPNSNCTPKISGAIDLYFVPYLPNNDAIILTAVGPGGTTTHSWPIKIPGGACGAQEQFASVVPLGGSTTMKVAWITSDAFTLVPSSSLGNSFTPVSRPVPEGLGTYSFLYTRSVAGDDHVRFAGPGCEVQAVIK
ncbi:MAG TPA: hypothetical protein VE974_25625 [Thermoanaerobaculia bacterium]|nr:hypothetical protein [Thermoanaerobaculia bacterium]